MSRKFSLVLGALIVIGGTAGATWVSVSARGAQTDAREQRVGGFPAWAAAMSNGFTFQPIPSSRGQWVRTPADGVNTQLLERTPPTRADGDAVVLAQIAAGSASVNRPAAGSRDVSFEFFGGRRLATDWSVVSVELTGSFTWDRRISAGSRDMSFRVTVASTSSTTGSAVIRSVTLLGPQGANWQDAFRQAVAP